MVTPGRKLADALSSLVILREDPSLNMQAFNLGVVDTLINDIEDQLLKEYMAEERTPMPTAVMASSLSQLWVFGVYELMRTARQRMNECIAFAAEVAPLGDEEREQRIALRKEAIRAASADIDYDDAAEPIQGRVIAKAAENAEFAQQLKTDLARSERLFRRVESLRVHLAKHEVPKVWGSNVSMAGYGRINMENGSIYWGVDLRNNEIDIVSRRDIAESCLELAERRPISLLPESVQKKVSGFPEHSYGVKRVSLILQNATEYEALISWNHEIMFALGFETLPFNPDDVIDARHIVSKEFPQTSSP